MQQQDTAPDHRPENQNDTAAAIAATRAWLERMVIGLNLCPFAQAVHASDRIRYTVSQANCPELLALDLLQALRALSALESSTLETTLLIHPGTLREFADYNDFLDVADALVEELGLTGEIQIASFHPDYRFADTAANAIENYTNRSPYPMLQLLREASISDALASYPEPERIFERNIQTLRALSPAERTRLGLPPT
jgi:uncharacterized protein